MLIKKPTKNTKELFKELKEVALPVAEKYQSRQIKMYIHVDRRNKCVVVNITEINL